MWVLFECSFEATLTSINTIKKCSFYLLFEIWVVVWVLFEFVFGICLSCCLGRYVLVWVCFWDLSCCLRLVRFLCWVEFLSFCLSLSYYLSLVRVLPEFLFESCLIFVWVSAWVLLEFVFDMSLWKHCVLTRQSGRRVFIFQTFKLSFKQKHKLSHAHTFICFMIFKLSHFQSFKRA